MSPIICLRSTRTRTRPKTSRGSCGSTGAWRPIHGKRDNAYLEDKTARRINPNPQTAMMLARTVGIWVAARHLGRTTAEVMSDLHDNPRKAVHLFTKRGML